MNFSEAALSGHWAPVIYQGKEIAEARYKPEGEPLELEFRVPQLRLQAADIEEQLTIEDLLNAADISVYAVESWQFLDESHFSHDGNNLELKRLLPSPPAGETYLTVHFRLQAPAEVQADTEGDGSGLPPEQWHALDATWKSIRGLEASIDALRLGMDGLRSEMETAFKKMLNVDEKVNGLQADIAQWTKAKSRVHFALPKVREFVHRATWALAVPERKRMDEVVKNHIEPRIALPDMDEVRERMGHLLKDRQVLYAQGNAVNQECRGILAEIQRALSTVQRNAADRARQKRSASRDKGKHL